jgi:hypothetical protein
MPEVEGARIPSTRHSVALIDTASQNLARSVLYENIYVLYFPKSNALADLLSNDTDLEAPAAPAIRSLTILEIPPELIRFLLNILSLVSRLDLVAIRLVVQSAAIVATAQSSHSTLQTLSLTVRGMGSCWQLSNLRSLKSLRLTSLDCA